MILFNLEYFALENEFKKYNDVTEEFPITLMQILKNFPSFNKGIFVIHSTRWRMKCNLSLCFIFINILLIFALANEIKKNNEGTK